MIIRKGDIVEVTTGDDAGTAKGRTTGRVLRILTKENKIVVEGINKVYKHLRPSRQNPQGGRLSKEMPIAASNVLLYCPVCTRGVRVARKISDKGKSRVCRKCGHEFGKIGA